MPPQIPTSTNATVALVLVGVFGMEVEQDAKILLPNMVLHGLHGNARYSGEILYMNWPQ